MTLNTSSPELRHEPGHVALGAGVAGGARLTPQAPAVMAAVVPPPHDEGFPRQACGARRPNRAFALGRPVQAQIAVHGVPTHADGARDIRDVGPFPAGLGHMTVDILGKATFRIRVNPSIKRCNLLRQIRLT